MILDCQNICKSFGTDVILNNISFHLEEKEKMAIVGINGAGKTTLLKIIMGEEEADSGQVIISKCESLKPRWRTSPEKHLKNLWSYTTAIPMNLNTKTATAVKVKQTES